MKGRNRMALLIASALMLSQALTLAAADESVQPSDRVSDPAVEGPIADGTGIRSGRPYGTTLIPLPTGWVEEEFFYRGTAYTQPLNGGTAAAYKSRILVRRPADPAIFNGTVVLEWNNVTIPHDHDATWQNYAQSTYARGFVYVGVAAQLLSIEASPLALKQWDPVRYGSLSHPGDTYSFDIYQQAAEAVLDPNVLGPLRPFVERRIALGASQSGGRLLTYINNWQEPVGLFHGFQPSVSGASTARRDLVPILWINSSSEVSDTDGVAPDSGLFRIWELAGPAHTTGNSNTYRTAMIAHAHSNGNVNTWDPETAAAWGYQYPAGVCMNNNLFMAGPIWGAALVTLDDWVRTGIAPGSQPRVDRSGGARQYDAHSNLEGGVRSALLDAPIATYFAGGRPPGTDPCGTVGGSLPLTGLTRVFELAKIQALYPTKQAYVDAFNAAVDDMLAAGTVLPEGAAEYRRRALTVNFWSGQGGLSY